MELVFPSQVRDIIYDALAFPYLLTPRTSTSAVLCCAVLLVLCYTLPSRSMDSILGISFSPRYMPNPTLFKSTGERRKTNEPPVPAKCSSSRKKRMNV